MSQAALQTQQIPTIYFVGVTTGQSSIMKIFPAWAKILGVNAQLIGYDAPLHAPPEMYRRIVEHIRRDPLSYGALITTHKIDLLNATRDLFDGLDSYAQICEEISCITKHGTELWGYARDPLTAGKTWEHFIPDRHWSHTDGQVLCLGAGGAAIAISVYLAQKAGGSTYPSRFIAVDISPQRLSELERIHKKLDSSLIFEYVLNHDPAANDALMKNLPAGSMVINATGLGKDRPGSPITEQAIFPENGIVWELNYRGELDFLHQAQQQATQRRLLIEDGWIYFLHGWSQIIADVFHLKLTPDLFNQLNQAAAEIRPR